MSRQRPKIGFVAGRDWQLAYTQHILPRAPPLRPPRRCPCTAALQSGAFTLESGSVPSRLMLAARSRRPRCSSPCAHACASQLAQLQLGVAAAAGPAAAPMSMCSAITAACARSVLAAWPDEPRSSSARGYGSLSALKAAWCLSSGCGTALHQASQPTIGSGSTSSCMAPRGAAKALCGDVTLVSPLRADGQPQPGSRDRDGAAIEVVRRRKLARLGPQRLVVLACDLSTACYKCGLCQFPRHPARCRLGRLAVTAVGGFLELRTANAPWHPRCWVALGEHRRSRVAMGSIGQPTLSEVVELAEPTLPSLPESVITDLPGASSCPHGS